MGRTSSVAAGLRFLKRFSGLGWLALSAVACAAIWSPSTTVLHRIAVPIATAALIAFWLVRITL